MAVYNSIIGRDDVGGMIPAPVSAEVISGIPAASAAMTTFRRVTMPSGTESLPVLSVLPTAYWVGETDTGLKQTTEVNWDNVTLTARELAVIVPIPIAVVEDAAVDVWAEVRPRLSEAFGAALDAAVLFGLNAPSVWPDSIAEQAVAAGNVVAEGTGVDIAEDINLTWAEVEADGFDVNVQYAKRSLRSRLRGLRDDNNQPILNERLQGGEVTIYGEDVIYVANGSWDNDYTLIVGDRNAAILGVRQDIRYEFFREGVIQDGNGAIVLNLMQQDAIALRATARFAYATANPASTIATDENTRFPFAVLTGSGS